MWSLFVDEFQLRQGCRASLREDSLLFTTKFPETALIWSTLERWKAESTLEPPNGFEHVTPGLGIQRLDH